MLERCKCTHALGIMDYDRFRDGTSNLNLFCRRLRNREAARRSRQRKQAKMVNLQEAVDTLERENLLLIKCIENFANKALAATQMKDGLKNRSSAIGTIVKPSPESHSFRREIPMLENLDGLQSKVSEGPLTSTWCRSSGCGDGTSSKIP